VRTHGRVVDDDRRVLHEAEVDAELGEDEDDREGDADQRDQEPGAVVQEVLSRDVHHGEASLISPKVGTKLIAAPEVRRRRVAGAPYF